MPAEWAALTPWKISSAQRLKLESTMCDTGGRGIDGIARGQGAWTMAVAGTLKAGVAVPTVGLNDAAGGDRSPERRR